jgi:hypothetical protein
MMQVRPDPDPQHTNINVGVPDRRRAGCEETWAPCRSTELGTGGILATALPTPSAHSSRPSLDNSSQQHCPHLPLVLLVHP